MVEIFVYQFRFEASEHHTKIKNLLAKYNVKIIMFLVTMLSCTTISNILNNEILKWVVHTKICM